MMVETVPPFTVFPLGLMDTPPVPRLAILTHPPTGGGVAGMVADVLAGADGEVVNVAQDRKSSAVKVYGDASVLML